MDIHYRNRYMLLGLEAILTDKNFFSTFARPDGPYWSCLNV